MIVGLSGWAGSGKDTVGAILVRRYGYERRAFADALKEIAYRIGWDGQKDDPGRRLLQDLGMAVRDVLGADAWLPPVFRDLPECLVVTDVRLPNEADAIRARGGVIWRIERPGTVPARNHISDTALDDWAFDARIANEGTLADLEQTVRRLVRGGFTRPDPFDV